MVFVHVRNNSGWNNVVMREMDNSTIRRKLNFFPYVLIIILVLGISSWLPTRRGHHKEVQTVYITPVRFE